MLYLDFHFPERVAMAEDSISSKRADDKKDEASKAKTAATAIFIFVIVIIAAIFGAKVYLAKQNHGRIPADHPFANMNMKMEKLRFPQISDLAREAFDITTLHSDSKSEWWYVNSHLIDEKRNQYTLMLTLLKPTSVYGLVANVTEGWAIPIYNVELLEVDSDSRSYKGTNFTLIQPDPEFFCYNLISEYPEAKANLTVCANKPPLEVGGEGKIKMGRDGESYYFSLTNCTVAGTLSLQGEPEVKVGGLGWIDRQWGNWKTADFEKWQWFSIHLFNKTEIMLFNFMLGGRSITPVGEVVYPDGTTEHNVRFRIKTLDNWVSERTNVSWASGWEIELVGEDVTLTVIPDFKDQEINEALWEGGCKVKAMIKGQEVFGRAFFEERRKTWEDRRRDLLGKGVIY